MRASRCALTDAAHQCSCTLVVIVIGSVVKRRGAVVTLDVHVNLRVRRHALREKGENKILRIKASIITVTNRYKVSNGK